jgi:hypothetical protein
MLAWPSSTPIREIHRVGPEFPELAQRCVRLETPIRVVTSAQNMGQPCEFRVSTLGRGWVHAAGLLLLSARLGPQETFLGPTNPVYDCINSDHPMENIPRPQITFLGRGRRIVHAGSYPNETPDADTVRGRPTAAQARSPRPCAAPGLASHAARGGRSNNGSAHNHTAPANQRQFSCSQAGAMTVWAPPLLLRPPRVVGTGR